ERARFVFADLILEGAGREDVGLLLEELFPRDRLASGISGDRAVLLDPVLELVRVEAFGVEEVARVIADRDRGDAEARENDSEVRADVAEALDDHRRALELDGPRLR